jgi:PEP-CTERM motif-containing protein
LNEKETKVKRNSVLMLPIVTVSVAAAACLFAVPASATLITSLPGGTVEAMPGINYFGAEPQTFGPGITWSSTNASNQGGSVFGYTGGYGFLGNGFWDGSLGSMAGVNDSKAAWNATDTMTFSFSTPVSAVGGFLNYVPESSNPTVIAVYDTLGNLIESANLTFTTGGGFNSGEFLGFSESTADIGSFQLTDNYVGITNLTVSGLPVNVPEPASLGLMGFALAGLGLAQRMRKR